MRFFKTSTTFSFVAAAVASPVISSAANALSSASAAAHSAECAAVNIIVNTLQAYPSATPFCSSYISIPTITSTVTKTSTSVVPTVLTTVTGTNTVTAVMTSTVTALTVVTTCSTASSANAKRNASPTTSTSKTTTTGKTLTTAGQPTPSLPSCVASFQSQQISTACSCLGIPTPTSTSTTTLTTSSMSTSVAQMAAAATASTTITSTVTVTSTSQNCPAPTLCGNQGLQWAYYNNTSGYNPGRTSGYPSFLPEDYKQQEPLYTSTTSSIGGIDYPNDSSVVSIYGSPTDLSTGFFVLNHRGYIFAQQTGTYVFTVSNVDDVDDVVSLWLGDQGYTGWKRDNDDLDVSITGASASYSYQMMAGQYTAVRIVFAQAQGPATFHLTVTAPDGTVILDSNSQGSPYLVQQSCDGRTAPPYAVPFGAET